MCIQGSVCESGRDRERRESGHRSCCLLSSIAVPVPVLGLYCTIKTIILTFIVIGQNSHKKNINYNTDDDDDDDSGGGGGGGGDDDDDGGGDDDNADADEKFHWNNSHRELTAIHTSIILTNDNHKIYNESKF